MKVVSIRIFLVLFILILINPSSLPAATKQRVALVIGTSSNSSAPLKNPVSIAKEIKRDGRFIAYDNGTVLNTSTNLIWAAKDNGADINWQNAKSYCENYRGGGYSDWRMPTQDELAGLYDAGKTYQTECRGPFGGTWDTHSTELIRLTCARAWASETRGSNAANFYFNTGGRYWNRQSYDFIARALPVRSGK